MTYDSNTTNTTWMMGTKSQADFVLIGLLLLVGPPFLQYLCLSFCLSRRVSCGEFPSCGRKKRSTKERGNKRIAGCMAHSMTDGCYYRDSHGCVHCMVNGGIRSLGIAAMRYESRLCQIDSPIVGGLNE